MRTLLKRARRLLFIAVLVAGPGLARGEGAHQSLADMLELDGKVATIGHRLAVANLELCTARQWLPGFTVHDLSQYGPDARAAASRAFGLDAGPGVLAVATGGGAERAGLRVNDVMVRIDGTALPLVRPEGPASFGGIERILEAIDAAFADGVAIVDVRRGEVSVQVLIQAEHGCASRFQLIPSRNLNALADGRYVQVTSAIGNYVDDQELAAILAHEFAHNVLRHRARLDAAGVKRGFLGNFGRNARLIRGTEEEADRLSIYLLDRAGYDIEAPVRFWSRFGRRGLNIFGSPTHGGWRRRVAFFQEEIAAVRRARASGQTPTPAFSARQP